MKDQKSSSNSSVVELENSFRLLDERTKVPRKHINEVEADYKYDPTIVYDNESVYSPSPFVKYDDEKTEITDAVRSYSPNPDKYIKEGIIQETDLLDLLRKEAIIGAECIRVSHFYGYADNIIFGKDSSSLDYMLRKSLFAIDLAKRMELQAARMLKLFSPFAIEDAKYHAKGYYLYGGTSIAITYHIAIDLLDGVRNDVLELASAKERDLWARLLVYAYQRIINIYNDYQYDPKIIKNTLEAQRTIYERFVTDPLKKYGYEKLFTTVPEPIKKEIKNAIPDPSSWYDTLITPAFNFISTRFGSIYTTVSQNDLDSVLPRINRINEMLEPKSSSDFSKKKL